MTIRTDAAPAVIQSVLTDAERHQLLARANYPHLQEEPGSYLVKITEGMVRTKLLAALPTGEARAVPPHQWQTTVAQMKVLAAELSLAAETMGGDDEESQDVELILAVAPAGAVQDDDNAVNDTPLLTVRLAEYPEEGVYPIDPHDPTGGRIDDPALPGSERQVAKALPDLNADLIEILGRPNFMCGDLAKLLRAGGYDIKCKAEHEQAAVIHFLLGHYLRHGSDWRETVGTALQTIAASLRQGGTTEC